VGGCHRHALRSVRYCDQHIKTLPTSDLLKTLHSTFQNP
jgi:hypothetical protein